MTSLQTDLDLLRTEHAINESMIASLLASPQQAQDHLRFWRCMMWGVNLPLLGVSLGGAIWAGLWVLEARAVLAFIVFTAASLVVIKLASVLWAQRRALDAMTTVALKHDLIGSEPL